LTLNAAELPDGSTLEFTIDAVKNPSSMAETGTFKIYLDTNDDYVIDMLETGLTVVMTAPGEIADMSVTAGNA